MSHASRAVIVVLLVLVATQAAQAGPVVSLSTDAPDLTSLTVGQSFNVQVSLAGLSPVDTLDFLAATVVFDASVLGTPTLTIGPIVPDPTGYIQSALPGLADASYDDLFAASGSPITDNGLFYSFSVTVQAAGQGTIAFDFVDSSGFDASGAPLPAVTAGSALTFSTVAVPEPSGIVLLAGGVVTMLAGVGLRGLSNHRPKVRTPGRTTPGDPGDRHTARLRLKDEPDDAL